MWERASGTYLRYGVLLVIVLTLLPFTDRPPPIAGADGAGRGPEPVAALEVDWGAGFRPLAGALVPSLRPAVRLTVLAVAAELERVTLTAVEGSPDESGNPPPVERDITDLFGPLTTGESATVTLDLLPGSQLFEVTVRRHGSARVLVAGMAVFEEAAGEVHTLDFRPFLADRSLGVMFEADTLLLALAPGTPMEAVSDALRALDLAPLDWMPDIGLVRARILDGRAPVRLGRELTRHPSPPITAAMPNVAMTLDDAVGEQMPARLTGTYRADAGNECGAQAPGQPVRHGCFEGGGGINQELRVFRYHFYYDTFAGHRLVNHVLRGVAAPQNVGIAVIDTGFGNGANRSNIPDAAFFNFAQAPFENGVTRRFNPATGVQECRANAAAAWAACTFGFAQVTDTLLTGRDRRHGTSVAIAAAGRPDSLVAGGQDRGILGTGPTPACASCAPSSPPAARPSFRSSSGPRPCVAPPATPACT